MLQRIDLCTFQAKQTYITGIVDLCLRNDIKKSCVYNQCELENRLLFESRTSNAIVKWLKSFTLLY